MKARFWLSLMVALVAILLTATDHFHGHVAYLTTLNTREPLLPLDKLQQGKAPAPLARKVTILFLDGLSYEASRQLPALQKLVPQGVWRPLSIEFPSYTYPGVVAYATGVPPLYSGMRLNHSEHLDHLVECAPLPSLIKESMKANLQVRISNGDWEAFSDLLDFEKKAPRVTLDELLAPTTKRGLDWIYFGEIDAAGHKHGGDSAQYKETALQADALLAKVITATDLTQDAVVIISDHGHLPQGGHGGDEPEITSAMLFAIGAGVSPSGEREQRSYLDVVPTVAALLGISTPAASLGRPMVDAFILSPQDAARLLALDVRQRISIEELITPGAETEEALALLSRLEQGDASAMAPAESLLDEFTVQRGEAFKAKRAQLGWTRLPWAILVSLFFLAGVVWLSRRKVLIFQWSDAAPTIVYTVLYSAIYYFAGYGISWSLPRGEAGFLVETFLYGAAAVTASFWLSRRLHMWQRLTEETLVMLCFFGIPYLFLSVWVGLDPVYLGDSKASFWVIFLATIGFYAHGPFGVALLVQSLRTLSAERRLQTIRSQP